MVVTRAAGRVVSASRPGTGRRPGIGARASARRGAEAGEVAAEGGEHDGSARAAATAAVVVRHRTGRAVGPDGARVRDAPDPDHHDAAAGAAARERAAAVVSRAGSAAAAGDDLGRGSRERRSAEPPDVQTAVPGASALASRAAVAAAPAAGVLVVDRGLPVVSAAAGAARSAAGGAPGDRGALIGVVGAGGDGRRGRSVVDPAGCSRDTFALGAVEVLRGVLNVVGVRPARVAGELPGAASPEAEPVHADDGASEVERSRDVHRQDAAGRPVPRRRGQAGRQSGRAVLGDADDLEASLALGRRGVRVRIGVEKARAGAGGLERQRAAPRRQGARGPHVFVLPRIVECGRAARVAAGHSVAVGVRVGGVDRGILHLDDQDQVARGDRRRGAPARSERDRGGPRRGRGRRGPVRVDDAGQAARAIPAGGGAVDRRVAGEGRKEEEESEKCA